MSHVLISHMCSMALLSVQVEQDLRPLIYPLVSCTPLGLIIIVGVLTYGLVYPSLHSYVELGEMCQLVTEGPLMPSAISVVELSICWQQQDSLLSGQIDIMKG